MFCVGVQHRLLPSSQYCRNGSLSVLSSVGKTEKQSGSGITVMLFLAKKFTGGKKKCEMVRCCDVTASSFVARVEGEVFTRFHTVAIKFHSSIWN
jgi:hypothetical protein